MLNYDGLRTILDNAPKPNLGEYIDYTTIPTTSTKQSGGMSFLLIVGVIAAILIFTKGK